MSRLLRFTVLFTLLLAFTIPTNAAAANVLIPDPKLEAAVRMQLDLLQKPLEEADLLQLTSLYPQDTSRKIKSLEGLQYAANLKSLIVPGNDFQQLEPIQNLTKLEFLVLTGNQISNIEPLRGNTGVSRLLLNFNQIENIEPLSGLTNLTDLLINNNQIEDISALSGLPLRWLDLTSNQIEDLSPLSQIQTLETLYVGQNHIAHMDALLDLPRLKDVHIEGNPLDDSAAAVIRALQAKGIKVQTVKTEVPPKNTDIRVNLDANRVPFDAPPFISNGTTLVQFRPVFDRLGLQISWDEQTRTITGVKEGVQVQLQIDNPIAIVNGRSVTLPVAPVIVDGNTFVPVRFISESVEAKVEWSEKYRTVSIHTKRQFESKDGKFHFTAYGLWRNLISASEQVELMETEEQEIKNAELAIRFFDFTRVLIYSESKAAADLKAMKLDAYLEQVKKTKGIAKESIIEQKQTKLMGRDALQLTYVNRNDWTKRIDTLLVFESDSHFYTLVSSSYEETYKGDIQLFQQILENMTFQEA